MNRMLISVGAVFLICAILGGSYVFTHLNEAIPALAMSMNYVRHLSAPAGTFATELAPATEKGMARPTPVSITRSLPISTTGSEEDWPSYNKALTSNRFSQLNQINRGNVTKLKVLCTYDTGQYTGFSSGLIEVDGALVGTTAFDIFSIDPSDCHQNWRVHENYEPAIPFIVNRGAAYMSGRLFRGTQDGRVLAYDLKTGQRLWAVTIADAKMGETVPAAPIAWNGLVFVGNAGGDMKGVKGRMYALEAETGKVVWEFYLVPKAPGDIARGPQGASPLDASTWKNLPDAPITGGATWTSYSLDPATGLLFIPGGNPAPDFASGVRKGSNLYSGSVVVLDAMTGAYKDHFKIVPQDWHDWDVSSAPAIIETAGGRKLMSVAPKDGHLYGFDLATGEMLYRTPVTRIENADEAFSPDKSVHFCPGSGGGAEWNGPAYDPETNLIFIGEVEWCNTVTLQTPKQLANIPLGKPWGGEASINPFDTWGKQDSPGNWAGWVYASDADTGAWRWRVKTNYPIIGGMTPTAGGLVFFGDAGGNFYAADAANGEKLWGRKIGGAIGGGVITYTVKGTQRIAAATGLTSLMWPTEITTAKVSILGLEASK